MSKETLESYLVAPKRYWYNHPRFPIWPKFVFREGNEWNTNQYRFHWLCFSWWTCDAPHLSFSFEINDRQIEIRIQPPYLFGGIFIPLFPDHYTNRFWRKAKKPKGTI